MIAGGGLVGLSTAMFLAHHGVAALVVEPLRGGSPVPRAAHFHVRTLELFRAAGIHAEVVEQSEREFLPEGAIISMDSLAGRKLADIIPSLNEGVDDTLSPCRRLFVTQPGLEPILRRRAERSARKCWRATRSSMSRRMGTVWRWWCGTSTRTPRTPATPATWWVPMAPTAPVRDVLGIPVDGRGVFSNSITIYFTADLWAQMGGKPLSVIYINNPVFGGFFRLAKDCQSGVPRREHDGRSRQDPDPDVANAARDTSEARLVELVRVGAGVPDLDVRIDGVGRWRATSDVAQRYDDGGVFLAGDSAHLMPPNGGFGGNTGIADAYDLAWKLAFVVKGVADPELLSTYDAERRPVGRVTVEQAYSRYVTRTATYLGATDYQPIIPDLEIELGYIYPVGVDRRRWYRRRKGPRRSPHQAADRVPGHPTCGSSTTGAGCRRSISSADPRPAGREGAPQGADWCDAARHAASNHDGLELEAYCVDGADVRLLGGAFTDSLRCLRFRCRAGATRMGSSPGGRLR